MQAIIEHYFEERLTLSPGDGAPPELRHAIDETLSLLDSGKLRVAAHIENEWVVDQWLKKAILLAFRLYPNQVITMGGTSSCYDKIPLKY